MFWSECLGNRIKMGDLCGLNTSGDFWETRLPVCSSEISQSHLYGFTVFQS